MKREHNSFRTPLIVEILPSGKKFKLHYDFTYYWKRKGILIRVKAGFITDLASIPRLLRLIIPKLGRWNKPAVIHDRLYQDHAVETNIGISYLFSRAGADLCFLDGMKDFGVANWERTLMYLAVRWFGFLAWRKGG